LNTFVVGDDQSSVSNFAGGTVSAEHNERMSIADEMAQLPQLCADGNSSTEEPNLDHSSCIPDTQLVQSAHKLPCLLSSASSPDAEMIPDTPDSASTGVRKTFHRSYLSSTSTLLAGSDGFPWRRISPPQKKLTKGKSQLRKSTNSVTKHSEEGTSFLTGGDASVQMSVSSSILPPAAAQLPYTLCDTLNKRSATDPFPVSKRCNHKVTPTKAMNSANSDAVYGTVPCQLFQEALNREKCRQTWNIKTNKENVKLAEEIYESLDPDNDPLLLEVLGELKVDSHIDEIPQKTSVVLNLKAMNSNVFNDVSNCCDEMEVKQVGSLNRDNDLEDILGEIRQQSSIQHAVQHTCINDSDKSRLSLSSSDFGKNLASSNLTPTFSASPSILNHRNLAVIDQKERSANVPDENITNQEASVYFVGLKSRSLKLEERTNDNNSVIDLTEEHMMSEADDVDGMPASCMQSALECISDHEINYDISANCDQNSR